MVLGARMVKPIVFVGSSSSEEPLKVATLLKELLREDLNVKVWNDPDVFRLSTTTFENLIKIVEQSDFGIFIFSQENEVIRARELKFTTTGNVVFEFGLFLGNLGGNRTFVVQRKSDGEDGISDLGGMTVAEYIWDERNGEDELRKALSNVAAKILYEVRREGPKVNNKKELAALYRIVNAICPSYPDAKVAELNLISSLKVEKIKEIRDIEEFTQDMIREYIYSILNKEQKSIFRIYFAYYVGDGCNINESTLYSCVDKDINNNLFKGEFIIAISNPNAFEESKWRIGRAIPGFDNGDTLSNCARVFQSGVTSSKPNLQHLQGQRDNYLTEEELAVYTEPIEWRTSEGNSRVGILAISSKEPDSITERIQQRVNFLAIVIGQLFSLYAMSSISLNNSQESPGNAISVKTIRGFDGDGHLNTNFINRTISIRREISRYFEHKFIKNRMHELKNGELKCNVSTSIESVE